MAPPKGRLSYFARDRHMRTGLSYQLPRIAAGLLAAGVLAGCGSSGNASQKLAAALNGRGALTPAQLKEAHVYGFLPYDRKLFAARYCAKHQPAVCTCALSHLDGSDDRQLDAFMYEVSLGNRGDERRMGAVFGKCLAAELAS